MKTSVLALALIAAVSPPAQAQAAADDSQLLKNRLLHDAVDGWERLTTYDRSCEGTVVHRNVTEGPGIKQPLFRQSLSFKCRDEMMLGHETGRDVSGQTLTRQAVLAMNDCYLFNIVRDKSDDPWRVLMIVRNDDTGLAAIRSRVRERMLDEHFVLEMPYSLIGKTFPAILREPGFQLTKMSRSRKEGLESVRIEFNYTPRTTKETALRGGWVEFVPQRDWRIREYDVRLMQGAHLTGQIVYDDKVTPPTIRRIQQKWLGDKGVVGSSSWDFESFIRRKIYKEEFTLAAYGLEKSEPDFDSSRIKPALPLITQSPVRAGASIPAGQEQIVKVTVRNPNRFPVRVVGALDMCTRTHCTLTLGLPTEISPQASKVIDVKLLGSVAGPLSIKHTFFTDVPGSKTTQVAIEGTIIESTHKKTLH